MLDSPFDAFEAFGSPFGRRRRDPFAVAGLQPPLVAAFRDGYFRANGAPLGVADLFTFARTGTATYFDSTGTLQTAADGEPRLGHHVYEGGQWINKGMLIESEAKTNLITHSEDLTHADWSAVGCIVTDNGDGSFDLTFADGGVGFIGQVPANNTANPCFSVEVKKVDVDDFDLFPLNGSTLTSRIRYTFSTDSLSLVGSDIRDYGSVDLGDGWIRVWVVGDGDSASGTEYIAKITASGQVSGDETIRVGHPQYEQASTPSSYIPTSGSTATRAAETRSVAAGDWPASTTAMSWYIEGLETYADEGTAGQVTLMDARVDANNRMTLTLDTDGARTGTFTLTVVNGGTSASVSTTNEITPGINRAFRVACTVTASGLGISLDGTDATAANAAGVPDLSTVDVDCAGMGCRIEERMWGADIGAAGRQAVTA